MAGDGIFLTLIGHKSIEQGLRKLPNAVQKKVVRQVLRIAAKRIGKRIGTSYAGILLPGTAGDRRGVAAKVMKKLRIRTLPRSRKRFGVGVLLPTPADLGIGGDVRYPLVQEFGSATMPPRSWLRQPARNEFARLMPMLKSEMATRVAAEFRKMVK